MASYVYRVSRGQTSNLLILEGLGVCVIGLWSDHRRTDLHNKLLTRILNLMTSLIEYTNLFVCGMSVPNGHIIFIVQCLYLVIMIYLLGFCNFSAEVSYK